MEYIPVSFIAGLLTILAPCVLPLLPIIVGGSAVGEQNKSRKWIPFVVAVSLAISVTIFTLLLRASTALIGVDPQVWRTLSGGLVILLGVFFLFPNAWEWLVAKTGLNLASNRLLAKGTQNQSWFRPIITGAALGPVFVSCSPTYGFLISTVLPETWFVGAVNIAVYAIGLCIMLLFVSLGGQRVIDKLQWASNPHGVFYKIMAVLFIAVGVAVLTGFDKTIETWILDNTSFYDPISDLEQRLLD